MEIHDKDSAYTPEQLEMIAKGPWIRTYTKRIVNPLDLRPEDIHIDDIAHHLSTSNRFVGALRTPVSIAQHSICVARLVRGWKGPEFGLFGLLHDASEAYLGDVSKWLKQHPSMGEYMAAEERAQQAIYEKFGLSQFDMEVLAGTELERADRLMVRVEGQLGFDVTELIPNNERYRALDDAEWEDVKQFLGLQLLAEMDWRTAKAMFMIEFKELTRIR